MMQTENTFITFSVFMAPWVEAKWVKWRRQTNRFYSVRVMKQRKFFVFFTSWELNYKLTHTINQLAFFKRHIFVSRCLSYSYGGFLHQSCLLICARLPQPADTLHKVIPSSTVSVEHLKDDLLLWLWWVLEQKHFKGQLQGCSVCATTDYQLVCYIKMDASSFSWVSWHFRFWIGIFFT